ncbi:carboxymuconolactone decarboxylase [Klebsiella variicola]|nr:carboxymuconolactone decarboxylase [Klebsiella variicola]
MMSSERYITGQEMLQRVDGHGGEAVVDSLQDIAPDFARYLIEFPFGDIYARPGLDLRQAGARFTQPGNRYYCRAHRAG